MYQLGFVYARSDSARLPNKAFLPLAGLPMIEVVMRRVAKVVEPILLTTHRPVDDDLAQLVLSKGYRVLRGDPDDLVQRTLQAVNETGVNQFLRVNGDSPFFDAALLSKLADLSQCCDLTTNLITRSFPYGISAEIISADWFCSMASSYEQAEAEHVTKHLYRQFEKARVGSVVCNHDYQTRRLTVDTEKDYQSVRQIFAKAPSVTDIHWWEVVGAKKCPPFVFRSPESVEVLID